MMDKNVSLGNLSCFSRASRKKGQFFSLYLVFLTLFFIGVVLMMYYLAERSIETRFLSPDNVLGRVNQKEAFELQEMLLVRSCAGEIISRDISYFENVEFLEEFEKEFFSRILDESSEGAISFRNYVFSDFAIGRKLVDDSLFDEEKERETFFKELYSFEIEDDLLKISRGKLEKLWKLGLFDDERINFPVSFSWSYSGNSLINLSNIKFIKLSSDSDGFDCDRSNYLSIRCESPVFEDIFLKQLNFLGPRNFFSSVDYLDSQKMASSNSCKFSGWIYDNYNNGFCDEPYSICNENHPDYIYFREGCS